VRADRVVAAAREREHRLNTERFTTRSERERYNNNNRSGGSPKTECFLTFTPPWYILHFYLSATILLAAAAAAAKVYRDANLLVQRSTAVAAAAQLSAKNKHPEKKTI
jgi:hypothetical protein